VIVNITDNIHEANGYRIGGRLNEEDNKKQVSPDMERVAAQRASERARAVRWDLNAAIFLFAILILVIILATYTKMGVEIVAPVAVFGLAMVWLVGWRRGRQQYERFYEEELGQELRKVVIGTVEESI